MKYAFSKNLMALLLVTSSLALVGCDGSSGGSDNGAGDGGGGGGDDGGGDVSTSYRQFVRDAYAQAPNDAPLTVNDKEFNFDVMDTAEFDDLVQGGTIDGGS